MTLLGTASDGQVSLQNRASKEVEDLWCFLCVITWARHHIEKTNGKSHKSRQGQQQGVQSRDNLWQQDLC